MSWNNENWQEQLEAAQRLESLRRQQDQLDELQKQTEALKSLERAQTQARMKAESEAKAKELAELRVKSEGKDPVAIDRLISLLVDSGNHDEAYFWSDKAVKLGNIRAANLMLQKYLSERDWKSVDQIQKLVEKSDVFKETSFALTLIAVAHFIQGDIAKAKQGFKKVISRGDLQNTAIIFMADISAIEGDKEQEALYSKQLEQYSGDDGKYIFSLYEAKDNFADLAVKRFEDKKASVFDLVVLFQVAQSKSNIQLKEKYLLELSNLGDKRATISLFDAFRTTNRVKEALQMSTTLSSQDSDFASEWVNTSNTYIFSTLIPQKKFEEVKALVDHAKKLDVKDQTTNAIGNGAIALYFEGRTTEAVNEFKKALEREDKFSEAEASWWLSEILADLGDKAGSADYKKRCDSAGGYKRPAFLRRFGKLQLR